MASFAFMVFFKDCEADYLRVCSRDVLYIKLVTPFFNT